MCLNVNIKWEKGPMGKYCDLWILYIEHIIILLLTCMVVGVFSWDRIKKREKLLL
jgi:hypothetical protein